MTSSSYSLNLSKAGLWRLCLLKAEFYWKSDSYTVVILHSCKRGQAVAEDASTLWEICEHFLAKGRLSASLKTRLHS